MSQLTHPRVHFVDLQFRARTWLAALVAVAVVAIPAALIVAPGDGSTESTQAASPGLRYDGGPAEGTRGISAQSTGQSFSVRGSDTFGLRP
jgi:hypothetical protein